MENVGQTLFPRESFKQRRTVCSAVCEPREICWNHLGHAGDFDKATDSCLLRVMWCYEDSVLKHARYDF